jgi:chlorobactene glucosyltransferase
VELLLSVVWFAVMAWLVARAYRQRQVLPAMEQVAATAIADAPRISIIVPARNEADNIGRCIASLLAQDYPRDRLRVSVVDDESTDGTGEIVGGLAASDRRLCLLRVGCLPAGWKGKPHACAIGAAAAARASEWLCFVDADVQAHRNLLRNALAAARERELGLLSLAPRHTLLSAAERLMLPCGHYLLAFSQDLARIQSPECPDAVATGHFMLVRREAYEAVGGHGAVRPVALRRALVCWLLRWTRSAHADRFRRQRRDEASVAW